MNNAKKLFTKSQNADNVEDLPGVNKSVCENILLSCAQIVRGKAETFGRREGGSNYRAGTITQQCRHLEAQLHRSRSG